MPTKKLYEVVCADNLDKLKSGVNDLVFEGYEPLGGIAVKGEMLMQPMKLNSMLVETSRVFMEHADELSKIAERARQTST